MSYSDGSYADLDRSENMNETVTLGIFVRNQFMHPSMGGLEMNQSAGAYGIRNLVNNQCAVGFCLL